MSYLAPPDIAKTACDLGEKKGKMSVGKMIIPGILAGAYIAFAALAATVIGSGWVGDWATSGLNKAAGAFAFTVGLILVVVAGSELFTGNNMYLAISKMAGKTTWGGLLKNWGTVYVANFIGAMIVVSIAFFGGFLFLNGDLSAIGAKAVATAQAKVSLTWGAAFLKGIGCNWLVCLAVWMSLGAQDVVGKIFSCFFPIFTFVLIGFEHSVANMFFIPIGILAANGTVDVLTWGNFVFSNLIPVTLGNIVGGGLFVGIFYSLVYLKKSKENKIDANQNKAA
ncbi:MAG: formate/nitrite transporter family protein [Clostridiales bacterium]